MNKKRIPLRLIAADLDGTLLDNTYTLPESLLEAVHRAQAQGVWFTLATGRLYPSALQYARQMGIEIPLISYNGALIRSEKEILLHRTLAKATLLELLEEVHQEPLRKFVFIGDNIITDHHDKDTEHYARALGVDFRIVGDLTETLRNEGEPTMAVLRGQPEDVARITPDLKKHFDSRLYLANSRPFFIDIAAPEVSKGSALATLASFLNIDAREVMAVGDSWNDLEMLAYAGIGVAVGNADTAVQAHADYVTKAPYAQGVLEAIEKFLDL